MLKEISCDALISSPIKFKAGLNAVVGANDAHNSIGKSSVLMLIDFAFGGTDFPNKCDDVIRNIGDFKVIVTFEFEKKYTFIRDTKDINIVFNCESQENISLKEFTKLLQERYFPERENISFRECVSGFSRIYQRDNYSDKRPLNIASKENWTSIRKRILQIFDKYWTIEALEIQKDKETKTKNDINGTFNVGAIKKITKRQSIKNSEELIALENEICNIKKTLSGNVSDIQRIINNKSLSLKEDKDRLVQLQYELNSKLSRVESNLAGNSNISRNSFNSIIEFFPEVNSDKLSKVNDFHNGIVKIIRQQLQEEKKTLAESISETTHELDAINRKLLDIVNSNEDSVYLLERLMELSSIQRDLKLQNEYFEKIENVKSHIRVLNEEISHKLLCEIEFIENRINENMRSLIRRIYTDNPIPPIITLGSSDYNFSHGDDRGTGKGYANMICLDLTFLEQTILPFLIHDCLLFKNMDTPAIERLISIYNEHTKQIFISIDEITKYNHASQEIINNSMFLKLDSDRVAFKKKWKNGI